MDYSEQWARAALAEMGVSLEDDAEYSEVALRLSTVVEEIRRLMAKIPDGSEALVPRKMPRLTGWET